MSNHSSYVRFDGIERRCHAMDDLWLGPCEVLGALIADETVSEAWERGKFDDVDEMELRSEAQKLFYAMRAAAVRHGHFNVWSFTLEHHHAAQAS